MKLSDFTEVRRVVELRARLFSARDQVETMLAKIVSGFADPDGISGLAEYGRLMRVSDCDLDGCYLGTEVAQAVLYVIDEKLAAVDQWLRNHGITIEPL